MIRMPLSAADVVDRARSLLDQRSAAVLQGTRKEYLFALLASTLTAVERGDYAIGALAAVRHRGMEILSLGANSLFSENNPRGHAEANALQSLLSLGRPRQRKVETHVSRWPGVAGLERGAAGLYFRSIADVEDPASSILYTSLEPCPMCTVITLNSGVKRLWIAERDDQAGAISSDGVHDMPPLWSVIQRAQGMNVEYFNPNLEIDQDITAVVSLVGELFTATKERLDQELSNGGLLSLGGVNRAIERIGSRSLAI